MASKRIERLRDKLLARGRPSLSPPPSDADKVTGQTPELRALAERVRPFAEVMYLVLATDSHISTPERDVLRGALRSLTEGALSTNALDAMLEEFEQLRERQGLELRLDNLASQLYADRADARLALGLATAAADSDQGVGPDERAVIVALAERLRISDAELQALLRQGEVEPEP
jgi:tellurite resistance protein